jgi:hypothetical protein
MLGEFPERYTFDEKLSIIQAYKKGGGVQGLAEIIDDEGDEEEQMATGAQGGQGGNINQNLQDGNGNGNGVGGGNDQGEEEEEDVDIDLEDPEDVKLIE